MGNVFDAPSNSSTQVEKTKIKKLQEDLERELSENSDSDHSTELRTIAEKEIINVLQLCEFGKNIGEKWKVEVNTDHISNGWGGTRAMAPKIQFKGSDADKILCEKALKGLLRIRKCEFEMILFAFRNFTATKGFWFLIL